MIALYMANFGLLAKHALYLSDYFERNKTEYVDRLMAVRQASQMIQVNHTRTDFAEKDKLIKAEEQ